MEETTIERVQLRAAWTRMAAFRHWWGSGINDFRTRPRACVTCYVGLMRGCAIILMWAAVPLAAQGLSGRRAPSFSLPDSTMKQHDILDYRGRWLLLDFMTTTCPHCKAISKTLEEVKTKEGAKVAILSIVLPPETMATVGRYIGENRVTSPILFDSGQVAASYFKATPAHPGFDTPHVFAIDPNGMIVRDWGQSSADTKDWVKELDALLPAGKK